MDGIEELSALEDLFLYNPGIEDLTPLGRLGRLRRLRLDVPRGVTDFSPIGRLHHLEELIINLKGDRSAALPRVGDLAGLRSLRGLALSGADGAGWKGLLDLPGLERVLLSDRWTPTYRRRCVAASRRRACAGPASPGGRRSPRSASREPRDRLEKRT